MPEIQFGAEVAAFAPAEIEFEPVMLVVDERQIDNLPPGDGKVPAAVRVPDRGGIDTVPRCFLVRHADHIIGKVFKRIAHIPHERPATATRTIPGRRTRLIDVSEPPDGIYFVVEMDGRKVGARDHDNAVPLGPGRGGFRG